MLGGGCWVDYNPQPKTQNPFLLMERKIKIKLVRSPICCPEKHKVIVRGLGLKKINQVVERPDTPGFRGMVLKVPHLLAIVD